MRPVQGLRPIPAVHQAHHRQVQQQRRLRAAGHHTQGAATKAMLNRSRECDLCHALIEPELVDAMVAILPQLLYSTQISVFLWFLAKNKAADAKRGFRDRRKAVLFISNTSASSLNQQTGMIDL